MSELNNMPYIKVPMFSDKEKVVKILEASGTSKAALARALEVDYTTLMRWLRGGVTPQPKQSRDIDQFFKDNVDIRNIVFELKKNIKNPLTIIKENQIIRDNFILKMTYNSNAIEGSRMTLKETKNVIDGNTIKGKELFEVFETINHKNAMKYMIETISSGFKIHKNYILKLHDIVMYNFNDKLPGKYRTGHINLTNANVALPSAQQVPVKMDKLIKNLNMYSEDPIGEIAKNHYEFEIIHPFFDGNGRVGRLVMATQFLSQGFAPSIIKIEDRYNYYMALEKCSFDNYKNIINMICDGVIEGYRLFL